MSVSNYSKLLFGLILVFVLLTIAANYSSDPYGAFSNRIEDRMHPASSFETNVRMAKSHVVRRVQPTSLIMGSSRAEIGLRPSHPGWNSTSVYNLGFPSSSFVEIAGFFEHALSTTDVKQVVLALDLFQFNPKTDLLADYRSCRMFRLDRPNIFNAASALCDIPYLWLSINGLESFVSNSLAKRKRGPTTYLENGGRGSKAKYAELQKLGSHDALFLASEEGYLEIDGLYGGLSEIENFSGYKVAAAFEKVLALAHEHDVDLRLLISPSHARQWQLQKHLKIAKTMELWKRYLVVTNQTIALEFGSEPFPLWDFANYNKFSEERVLGESELLERMTWYWESSHYSHALGDLALDQVLSGIDRGLGPDISPLDSAGLNDWLSSIDAAERRYEAANHNDLRVLREKWSELIH